VILKWRDLNKYSLECARIFNKLRVEHMKFCVCRGALQAGEEREKRKGSQKTIKLNFQAKIQTKTSRTEHIRLIEFSG
jgi:hypothetical protein